MLCILFALALCNGCVNNNTSQSKIYIDSPLDWGQSMMGDTIKLTTALHNFSNYEVCIHYVETPCGCIMAIPRSDIIKKNDSVYIDVQYVPLYSDVGYIEKNIFVHLKAQTQPLHFLIKGKVRENNLINGPNARHSLNDHDVESIIEKESIVDHTNDCPHDLSKYDTTVYSINHMESYAQIETKIIIIDKQGSVGIDLGGVKFHLKDLVNIGINTNLKVGTKIEVYQPVCVYSKCNICRKDHMEKKPKFLRVKSRVDI